MNTQRTPPNSRLLVSQTGSGGGSEPNLSTYDNIEVYNINKKLSKRNRDEEYDLQDFRDEMMNFFRETFQTQNNNIAQITNEIRDLKEEVKTMKDTSERIASEYNKMQEVVQTITNQHKITRDKITALENDIVSLKSQTAPSPNASSIPSQNEFMYEIQDRLQREKNIIMIGIPETHNVDPNLRKMHDIEEANKLLKIAYQECPTPVRAQRLGKYDANKPRLLKIVFQESDIPKYLLKNKAKLPSTVRIYSDQTATQRSYLQNIRDELKRRVENGETNLKIKYVKGIPTIIKNNSTTSKN